MARIQTLNSLPDLQNAEYGRPYPRNGLYLLYWFAKDCVKINDDNTVSIRCRPSKEDYGFERFPNEDELFPQTGLKYFEVGNLHHEKAEHLPEYVRKGYTHHMDKSNTDRIVIGIPGRRGRLSSVLNSVYVTSHDDEKNFDPFETYRITPQLLSIISSMERQEYIDMCLPPQLT